MGKLLALLLVLAVAAGAIAAYNSIVHGVLQPYPLSWNRSEDELRLVDLERERRDLAAKLGAGQRVMSLAGAPQAGLPDEDDKAALARFDREIATLRARIGSAPR